MDKQRVFEIPLTEVSRSVMQTSIGTKNDVSLEFHQYDTTEDNESLSEVRFSIIGATENNKSAAQIFHEKILSKADIVSTSGKGIVSLNNLPVLTPRGKYDIEMFSTFMKLHGKTYDYKILFSTITRLFQLPKPDQKHIYFILSLEPPIKQGQTRYPHLVFQFSKDENVEVTLNLSK